MNRPQASAPASTALSSAGLALLAGLTVIWGANWPIMKIVLSEVTVWWFRSACLVIGGVGLLTIAALTTSSIKVPVAELRPLLTCALFNIVGWHMCAAYGVLLMPAGRAVIIAYTMPVCAVLLGKLMLDEPLTRAKLAGLALGASGLVVLIGPDLLAVKASPIGALFMLLSALCWAYGTILFKLNTWSIPVSSNVGWQLIASSVPITIGALLLEPVPDVAHLSPNVLLALAYVFLFPMLFGQWAYFKIVHLFPASIAAIGTLAIPVVGVFSSALMLDEPIGAQEVVALALICASLASVLVIPALRLSGRR